MHEVDEQVIEPKQEHQQSQGDREVLTRTAHRQKNRRNPASYRFNRRRAFAQPGAQTGGDAFTGVAVAIGAVDATHASEVRLVIEQLAGFFDDTIGVGAHQQHGSTFKH